MMWWILLAFVGGLFVGAVVALIALALCYAGEEADAIDDQVPWLGHKDPDPWKHTR